MRKLLLTAILSLIFSTCAWAGKSIEVVELSSETEIEKLSLIPFARIMEDSEHKLTLEDLMALDPKEMPSFPDQGTHPNLGFTHSAFWVYFELANTTDHPLEFTLQLARPLTDRADLYLIDAQGNQQLLPNGDLYPISERALPERKPLYNIRLEPKQHYRAYLHLESDGEVITLPINLWNKDAYLDQTGWENLLLGCYYGILIIVTIIYLFFFFGLKDKTFLYYVFYVFSIFLLQFSLDGLAMEYFWPNAIWWGNHIILISGSLSVYSVLLYSCAFLKLKEQLPIYFKVFQVMKLLCLVSLAIALCPQPIYAIGFPVANGLGFLSILVVLAAIIATFRKGFTFNPFFALAFLVLLTSGVIFILGNFNVLDYPVITQNAIKGGSAIEVVLLSLSMVEIYRKNQKDKEHAQALAMEKLEEMNRLKDRINSELEKQVIKRTAEIREKNQELAEKNKDITDSIVYAKRIQQAILPPDPLVGDLLPDSFVFYRPKDIVSGDFYWMEKKGDKALFAAVDCTGHGVPGAFMSIVGQNSLFQAVREKGLDQPAAILDHLHQGVRDTLRKELQPEEAVRDGMDIALCSLDKSNGRLEYAGAYNPLYLIRPGSDTQLKLVAADNGELDIEAVKSTESHQLFEIKADKKAIGSEEEEIVPYKHFALDLLPGDTIYLFSDGFADQFGGPKGKKFKYSRFKDLLLSLQQQDMPQQMTELIQALEDWQGELEQLDDICLIGVRWQPTPV